MAALFVPYRTHYPRTHRECIVQLGDCKSALRAHATRSLDPARNRNDSARAFLIKVAEARLNDRFVVVNVNRARYTSSPLFFFMFFVPLASVNVSSPRLLLLQSAFTYDLTKVAAPSAPSLSASMERSYDEKLVIRGAITFARMHSFRAAFRALLLAPTGT